MSKQTLVDVSYNGWSNYETWNAALWIGEDGWLSNELGNADFETACNLIRETLENINEEATDSLPVGMASDLINASFQAVNVVEIAKTFDE